MATQCPTCGQATFHVKIKGTEHMVRLDHRPTPEGQFEIRIHKTTHIATAVLATLKPGRRRFDYHRPRCLGFKPMVKPRPFRKGGR